MGTLSNTPSMSLASLHKSTRNAYTVIIRTVRHAYTVYVSFDIGLLGVHSTPAATVVDALVASRVDYCNAILAGAPEMYGQVARGRPYYITQNVIFNTPSSYNVI